MRVAREVEIADRKVVVVELTVGEIRAWLASAQADGGDIVDALLFEEFDPDALVRMTNLSAADIDAMTPSELTELAGHCREVNRDFFAMRQRMVKAQQTLLAGISNATR